MNINIKKGQTGVFDLIVAVFIATIAIMALALSWDRSISKLNEKNEVNDLQIKLYQISDLLITSEGNKDEWDELIDKVPPEYPTSLGLAKQDRVLYKEKIDNLSYIGNIEELLNIEPYGFQIVVKELNGNLIKTIGSPPQPNSRVFIFTRYASLREKKGVGNPRYRGEQVEIITKIWKD